jgi:hypothetical protein
MRLNPLPLLSLVFVLTAGCVAPPAAQSHFSPPPHLFPADGFITQRAVFTARGRQFPLNGYLALSETGGKRLVITENFGHVVADVLVKPDGEIFVMQSSRMFSPKYIRLGVAADLQCVFGGATNRDCPVEMPGTNHFMIKRHGYTLDLRILDVKPGAQPANLFDETKAEAK